MTDSFEQFWRSYPRRIAKGNARKAFAKAMQITDLQTILAGVERYKLCKPDYADWAHPASWLNGERWEDEWDAPGSAIDDALLRQAREADEREANGEQQRTGTHLRLV